MTDAAAPETATPANPPASATSFRLNCVALVMVLGGLFWLRSVQLENQNQVLVLMAITAVPIVFLDLAILRVHRRASTTLDWDKPFEIDQARVLTKILGLALTVGLVAFAFWLFPEYHGGFYDPFYALLRRFWLPLVVAAPFYIAYVDARMRKPRDAYWQMGRVALFHFEDAERFEIANHLRGWLVKAFFLPLMVVFLHSEVRNLVAFDLVRASWANLRLYDFLYSLVFGLDLLFTTVGYILSFKIIDTHIRTAEPTMLGWAVALFCYQPFFGLMERQYVHYDESGFGTWLRDTPPLRGAWAACILLLLSVYVLATVTFGVRFSNLTHRGILTNGPYRFSKHPAYLSKNLSWWMVSMPFMSSMGWAEALRHSVALGLINTMYFLRARTEERHLSRDPTYVAYALWMNERGVLSFLGRAIPFFRYRAPAAQDPEVAARYSGAA